MGARRAGPPRPGRRDPPPAPAAAPAEPGEVPRRGAPRIDDGAGRCLERLAVAAADLGGGGVSTETAVAVCIVAHNSAADLPGCLEAVGRLEHRPLRIVVVDCASEDGSLDAARRHAPPGIPFQAIELGENRGFTGGMNAALAAADAPWVLSLNADARPAPDYVTRL